jgi:hypothetical protein
VVLYPLARRRSTGKRRKMSKEAERQLQQRRSYAGPRLGKLPSLLFLEEKDLMVVKCALLILTIVGSLGCDELSQQQTKKAADPPPPKVVHHFDPIAKSEGSLAVDTATGQMCKTWDWICTQPKFYNSYTKEFQDNSSYGISCSAIANMPTCKEISDK